MAQYVVWEGMAYGAGPITVDQLPRIGEEVRYLGRKYVVGQVQHDYDDSCVRIYVTPTR